MKFFDRFWKKQTQVETKEERCIHVFAPGKTMVMDITGDFYLANNDYGYCFDIISPKITKIQTDVKRCTKCGLYSAEPFSRKVFDGEKWRNELINLHCWLIDKDGDKYLIHCEDDTGDLILERV